MNFRGVIFEESLKDPSILNNVKILSTEVEKVTDTHQTPWLLNWTLHNIEVEDSQAEKVVQKLSQDLEYEHNWYADFKNDLYHYIIFRGKVFKVKRSQPKEYEDVKRYGVSKGIPDYQLDFSPQVQI